LAATGLVHEAYIRLAGADVDWQDRAHFLSVAARQMRRILVDRAKNRRRQKRGSGAEKLGLEGVVIAAAELPIGVTAVDEALGQLAAFDPRKCEIIELVYFGGLNITETSEALSISPATIHRELKMAKAWLCAQLKSRGEET